MIATVQEAYDYVLQGLQKEGASTLDPTDFEFIWNKSAQEFVNDTFRRVEKDQERMDDLRTLIPPPEVLSNTGGTSNGAEVFDLPVVANPTPGQSRGYMFMLSVCQRIVSDLVDGVPVFIDCPHPGGCAPSRMLTRDQRYTIQRDAFWEASLLEPYHYFTGNEVRTVVPSPYWTHELVIEYVRHPLEVVFIAPGDPGNVDPDLPPHANRKVADIAIRKQLEIIESRRHQSVTVEQQLSNRSDQ